MPNNNEQPVIKRQRIENKNIDLSSGTETERNHELADENESPTRSKTPPDILVLKSNSSKSTNPIPTKPHSVTSSSLIANKSNVSIPNSITSSPASSHNSSIDEVDKMSQDSLSGASTRNSIPDLLRTNISNVTTKTTTISTKNMTASNNIKTNTNETTAGNYNECSSSFNMGNISNESNEMAEFEEYLVKQCLCGVNEMTLRKPFESHYNHDPNGTKRIAMLNEWPNNKLLQFLSNLQLLFDIYLKQNSKGFICSRIMDICDALIRNDHNLIDEIIELANFNNQYVQFLSGRVLASFLVIAKNNMDDNWLKKLVDMLFSYDRLNEKAVRKINFSLEIIKRIVEWKDIELHPLEDENSPNEFVPQEPPLENNYFVVHFNSEMGASSSSSDRQHHNQARPIRLAPQNGDCQMISLTDSESFDTTHLKCVTIKILENKWPALVKNMSQLMSSRDLNLNSENCILIFLCLWENIISVKANLSIVETLPFYAQLDKFELLLQQPLSCTVYKQMLSLFNEALCYGSTLALQDLLPEETCMLAHQIVRHVKDRMLDSLPRRAPENCVSLLGYKGQSIIYENNWQSMSDNSSSTRHEINEIPNMDKTILQKMVLLVLKSVAVTVKEIRSDSSDSSIDSTDYDAFQDMVLIERSIRDVLKKLEDFMKTTLEFHPECHFSKILIHLFDDQDDHLIEAMVCTLDVTSGISFRNNAFPELVSMLNPVLTFLEFLKMISNSSELLLDLLVSNETCFLLYLLRFLKYIRINWSMFISSCQEFDNGFGSSNRLSNETALDNAMSVLIRLRLQISRLVSKSLYPYDISPVLRLLESCESLYEGNELS